MNFFKKAKNALYNVAAKALGNVGSLMNTLSIRFGRSDSEKMELFSGWVYKAIDKIAKTIAGSKFKLMEVKGDKVEEINDHELLNLIRSPNKNMHGWQFWYKIVAHLLLTGDAYILMPDVENENDVPESLHLLSPGRVSTEITETVPAKLKHYEVQKQKGVGTETFKPYKIIHLTLPNPENQFEGFSPTDAIEDWILEDKHASRYNLAFFQNGAKLSGMIESDTKTTPDQLKTMKSTFENLHAGTENAYKVAALPKGKKYKEMSGSRKDMDFIEGQRFTMDKILAGFEVPKTLIGMSEQETNRATAETAEFVFAKYNIAPFLEMIVNALNFTLIPRFEDNIALSFEDPVPADKEHEIKEMKAATGGKQSITINEARSRYFGLKPIEGGNKITGRISETEIAEDTEDKDAPEHVRKARSYYKRKNKGVLESAEKASEQIADIIKKNQEAKEKKVKDLSDMDDDEFEKIWKAFDDRMAGFEARLLENIKDFNKAQKETVLENLKKEIEKGSRKKDIQRSDLFEFKEQVAIMFDFIDPLFQTLVEDEAAETAELLGIDVDLDTPKFRELSENAATLLSQSYNSTTSDRILDKVNEGIEAGEGFNEIADRVEEVYDFADRKRSVTVAKTETIRLGNASARTTYEESGMVESVKWYTAVDDRVCQYCRPMHGEIVGIEESFFGEDEDEFEGDDGGTLPLDYTETVEHPPIHPRCRCYIRPEEINVF